MFEVLSKSVPALLSEPETVVDPPVLVITPEQVKLCGHLDFKSQKETNSFQRIGSSVHVISKEYVFVVIVDFYNGVVFIALRGPEVEEAHEVLVLTVDVSENDDRGLALEENGLVFDDGLCLVAELGLWRYVRMRFSQQIIRGYRWC